ncbi:zinc finger and BTB domain-containing protein 14-like isoform X2 [Periplaneta americana]|uniref:zinc finger and BTB domain-containing protein 14-like isoform X2 n=1 Tax=Periplaneta americana TaxID=6978 RepID=UPI0037E75727
MSDNAFHLKWNNHLQNMYSQLETLYSHQSLVDVSLSCTDGILKAHRVVLSACSPYFESIFRDNYCKHPVLILKGVTSREMQALLRFMYKGSVEVLDVDLQSFMCTANELKIRGLADELLKDSLRLATEKDVESSDDDHVEKENCILDVEDLSQRNDSVEMKITDVRTENIEESVHEEESKDSDKAEEKDDVKDNPEKPSESQNKDSSSKVPDTHKTEDSSTEPNTTEATSSKMPPVATPYARETRFKGRKRVSVGIRPSNRTKSTEKRETENKPIANENQPVQVKEEEQDMDMFCISALAERNAGPDSEDTDTVCAFCYLDCHTSTDLKKHLRVHTGEKPHECDLCELAFARASHLARHRRVHTGERPFTCSGCGRTFSRQDKLKQHARRHHAAEPVKGPTMRAMRIDKPRRPRGRPPKLNRGTAWAKQLLEESTTGGLNKADSLGCLAVMFPSRRRLV